MSRKETTRENFTLITGASSGIGNEMAINCAKRGFNLLLISLPETSLKDISLNLSKEYGVKVHYLEINLNNLNSPKKVYEWCESNDYNVNMLINNVGMGGRDKFENLSLTMISTMINLNIYILSAITNLFIPMLKAQQKAYILNVSSTASYFNIPNKIVYSATKAYVNTFTTSLRNELSHTNISVSLLCPGGSTHRVDLNVEKKLSSLFTSIIHETPKRIAEDGISGMLKNKKVILPGLVSKFYVFTSFILPSSLADQIVRKLFHSSNENEPSAQKFRTPYYKMAEFAAWLLVLFIGFKLYNMNSNRIDAEGTGQTDLNPARLVQYESFSAVTPIDKMRFAFLNNNDCKIYVYNRMGSKIERAIPYGDKGHFNGLAYKKGYFYLLRHDGFILSVPEKSSDAYDIATYDIPPDVSNYISRLYPDLLNNRPLIDVVNTSN
ncbi:SDR family NAD(P)-dependent oxidoreductase [Flavihumibacter sp. R14]|nr:SDR family NAD(P)-dependent oxidoreductase [Flavihumibacter soli]